MENEFQEIIKKNLPAQVGEALKTRLEIADSAEKQIPALMEQIEKLKTTVKDQDKRIISQNELDEKLHQQKTQAEQLLEDKRNLEVEKLKIQLEAEKDKSEFSKSVALGLVRNQEFRRTVFDSKHSPEGRDQYGNQVYATHSTKADETKTIK
jgi:hypothetical protein